MLFLIEPEARSANPFGAFVNRNHFAAWLLLVAAPVVRLLHCPAAHSPDVARDRWRQSIGQILSSGVVFTALAAIVHRRRAAADAVAVGAGRPRRGGDRRLAARTAAHEIGAHQRCRRGSASPAPLLLIVVLFVDVDGWATRVEQSFGTDGRRFSRLTIWRESLPIDAGLLADRHRRRHLFRRDDAVPAIARLGRLDAALGALQQRALALRAGRQRRRTAARPSRRCGARAALATLGLSRGSCR